ncbi:MAG: flagellar hook-basal body complex protein, partial [Clostridiaceae bacterium]|nr:flagellar hook-basal body complex protein [Clostridiaceae bacterium]
MTGAMYASVAGLKTHMSAMNVIGHNIANVNTNAYKASSYTFKESLYTTSRGGSDGTPTNGGVNPAQIGYGCSIGSIDMDMGSKNYSPTGRELDICIDGDGFLMVGDKTQGPFTSTDSLKSLDLERLGRLPPTAITATGRMQVKNSM